MSEKNVYYPPGISKGPAVSFFGALALSGLIFLALPLTQLLSGLSKTSDRFVADDIAITPPPAPPPEQLIEEEPEPEPEEIELEQEVKPIDLAMIDAALNPGFGDSLQIKGAIIPLGMTPQTIAEMDIFELRDLDNNPRRLVAIPPIYPFNLKRMGVEGFTKLMIIIDKNGKVIKAMVKESSQMEFEEPSIRAVMQWKFEPGTRNGKPVKVRRIQPFNFKLNE